VKVSLSLSGIFKDKLPKEAHGKTVIDVPGELTLSEILESFDIHSGAICVINGQFETDFGRALQDGDQVQILRPMGGG
jgi:sulfur carrier protein ThiS